LKPLAKNPPNGAIIDANTAMTTAWNWIGAMEMYLISRLNYKLFLNDATYYIIIVLNAEVNWRQAGKMGILRE
jgi:hypothetical protein